MECFEILFFWFSLWSCFSSVLSQDDASSITQGLLPSVIPYLELATDPLPKRTSAWKQHVLFNMCIIAFVVLVIVAGLFFLKYVRSNKKSSLRRYTQLNRIEDEDDIELSIYEKK